MSIIKAFQIVNEYCKSSAEEYSFATDLISEYANHHYQMVDFEFINHTFGINYEK